MWGRQQQQQLVIWHLGGGPSYRRLPLASADTAISGHCNQRPLLQAASGGGGRDGAEVGGEKHGRTSTYKGDLITAFRVRGGWTLEYEDGTMEGREEETDGAR
ncbi:hypothetical protein Pcinc_001859 [Petrolisthes cinctipes]|uniref:Uncharacterized protein n=1 Tax=Petrolisthes cinctipes TaxID=88211 RepID=A0AAE1L2S6_PETCI|nr:hypothetical protein Pcinc_001859 [Petrolisthes cinctipes]